MEVVGLGHLGRGQPGGGWHSQEEKPAPEPQSARAEVCSHGQQFELRVSAWAPGGALTSVASPRAASPRDAPRAQFETVSRFRPLLTGGPAASSRRSHTTPETGPGDWRKEARAGASRRPGIDTRSEIVIIVQFSLINGPESQCGGWGILGGAANRCFRPCPASSPLVHAAPGRRERTDRFPDPVNAPPGQRPHHKIRKIPLP